MVPQSKQVYSYPPAREKGTLFFSAVLLVLLPIEIFLIHTLTEKEFGLGYFLLLMAAGILAVPAAFLIYRFYSLLFSSYEFERNSLTIRWGKRNEVIPLNAIEWIRTPQEMPYEVPWSVLPMPGAYLGTVENSYYGKFEFLASDTSKMLFLGTAKCIFVISPENPSAFMNGFERILQLGSLSETNWETVRPANWIIEMWKNKIGRRSIIIMSSLLAVLFLWVGFRFKYKANVTMQFSASGMAQEVLPVSNIIVIPILAAVTFIALTVLGGKIHQNEKQTKIGEIIWVSGIAAVLQYLIAAFILLS